MQPICQTQSRQTQSREARSWQQELREVFTDPALLFDYLQLDRLLLGKTAEACRLFPLRVPLSFAERMSKGNPDDPLLKQVLPVIEESQAMPGFIQDPLGESLCNPIPGLLQKYATRVLLTVTGACGIHCRYCFRRHFPYEQNNPGFAGWGRVIDYILSDPDIKEVILSGGDPLVATDEQLSELALAIQKIPQVKTLRIHTRLPVVIPARVCDSLLQWLGAVTLQKVVVVHCNHAQEIDGSVVLAFKKLRDSGMTVFNQSVLLKGINDDVGVLVDLSERLFSAGVIPYYLHLLDKVEGTGHFEVSEVKARQLMLGVQARLPGYLVPQLVREEPGASAKTRIVVSL